MTPISLANSTAIVGKYVFENSKKKIEKIKFSRKPKRNRYVMDTVTHIECKVSHFNLNREKTFFRFFSRIFEHICSNNSGRIDP